MTDTFSKLFYMYYIFQKKKKKFTKISILPFFFLNLEIKKKLKDWIILSILLLRNLKDLIKLIPICSKNCRSLHLPFILILFLDL